MILTRDIYSIKSFMWQVSIPTSYYSRNKLCKYNIYNTKKSLQTRNKAIIQSILLEPQTYSWDPMKLPNTDPQPAQDPIWCLILQDGFFCP